MFDLYKEEYSSKAAFYRYIADPDFILAYAHNVLEDALRCAVPVPSEEAQEAPPELFSWTACFSSLSLIKNDR